MLYYGKAEVASDGVDLEGVCPYLLSLLLRNIATRGWILRGTSGRRSLPGCIIASPSRPGLPPSSVEVTDQDYVFHWTRDAAIVAIELAAWPGPHRELLDEYVLFSAATQRNCPNDGFACFRVDATPRDGSDPMELAWSEQSDGPALRTLAFLEAWPFVSAAVKEQAGAVIVKDIRYLLSAYARVTRNLWEETSGFSFFARSVQLRAFETILAIGAEDVLAELDRKAIRRAIEWLQAALLAHWVPARGYYVAIRKPSGPFGAGLDAGSVMASVYGAVATTDSKLLATASKVRRFFTREFTINRADAALGLGPLIGRYPGDVYDGDWGARPNRGNPWLLCSANLAELYYRVAVDVAHDRVVRFDADNAGFFADIGIVAATAAREAVSRLRKAGDVILRSIIRHSDFLELSEEVDRVSGYEKSVRNLSWSYASYLSAIRARKATDS